MDSQLSQLVGQKYPVTSQSLLQVVEDLSDRVQRVLEPSPSPEFIEHCKKMFTFLQQNHQHWIRYVRGKPSHNQDIADLHKIVTGLVNLNEKSTTQRPVPIGIVNRTVNLYDRMYHNMTHKSRRPRGVVMFAVVDDHLFGAASYCRPPSVWNKHVGRYLCVDRILRGANSKQGGVMEIDLSENWTYANSDNVWSRQFPPPTRKTAFDLFKHVISRVGLNAENQSFNKIITAG